MMDDHCGYMIWQDTGDYNTRHKAQVVRCWEKACRAFQLGSLVLEVRSVVFPKLRSEMTHVAEPHS